MQTVAKLREFFGRAKSADTADPADQPNILVISDLHLGEDIKPFTGVGYLRHIARLERELENFIDHYTRTRHDGRPWRRGGARRRDAHHRRLFSDHRPQLMHRDDD